MSEQLAFEATMPKGKVLVSNGHQLPDPFPNQATIDAVDRAGNVATDGADDQDPPWTDGRHGYAEWSRAGGDLVIPDQPAIAVYWNSAGAAVIRQEGQYGADEDHFVYVQPHNLPTLIAKLQAMLKAG